MHPDRADRAREWLRQRYNGGLRGALREVYGFTDTQAHKVTTGQASDESIALIARKMNDADCAAFLLFTHGRRPVPALEAQRHFWITAQAVTEAPADHDIAARIYLGRSPAAEVGFAEVAMRNLGWVAVTLSGHVASLRFHANADPGALARTKLWLHEQAGALHSVAVNGQGADVASATADLERRAIAGSIKDASNQGWRIERDSLDRINASNLKLFVQARRQSGNAPGALPIVIRKTGLLPWAALYHREKTGETRTLHIGENLGIDPVEALGRRLEDRREQRYVGLLKARLETARIEPTFHRLGLETAGHWWNYGSVVDADRPHADGSQTLAAVVHIKSKVAA